MGKEELNNIKKMYLLRMHTNKKYAIIVFCVAIVIALVDILSMVINFSTDKDVFYLNLNRNSVALFWIVILVLVIKSFNIGEYKNNYMVFPQNSVTRYVSAYLADVTTFGIASLFQVMNQLILFGAVSLVSLFNKNIKLINVFSMKTVFAEFVYLLGYFLLITAIIKLFAVIYRKSMAVFGVITITLIVGALSYRNILQNIAAYAKENNKLFLYEKAIDLVSAIAGFYKREYNMGLFFLKIVVTLVIAFFIGFIIEKKIRDSKSLTFGGNQRAILIRIMAVCGFTMAIAGVTMHYDSNVISKTATEKKTYPLQIKEDDKYPQTISTSYDMSAVGVGNIDITKIKNPRIVFMVPEITVPTGFFCNASPNKAINPIIIAACVKIFSIMKFNIAIFFPPSYYSIAFISFNTGISFSLISFLSTNLSRKIAGHFKVIRSNCFSKFFPEI